MPNKKFFDIIFSTNHFRGGRFDLQKLFRNQEIRDFNQEELMLRTISKFRNDLMTEVGTDKSLEVTFGFNITSSLNFLLNVLPNDIVTSVSEFLPVITMIEKSSRKIASYIDLSTSSVNKIIRLRKIQKKEIVLLITHIAYSDGRDVLSSILDDRNLLAYLSDYKVHIIIDGAHAIGNNYTISDIAKIKKSVSDKITLASFTYIFDCYKWLQGIWGMSIIVSDLKEVIQSHDFIFPNGRDNNDEHRHSFSEPVPSSFNPSLICWFLNAKMVEENMKTFRHGVLKNKKLTHSFLKTFKANQFRNISIVYHEENHQNNIISLQVGNPAHLHSYLYENNFVSHLIAQREIKIGTILRHFPGSVRLCFSSDLIKATDIVGIIKILKKYDRQII